MTSDPDPVGLVGEFDWSFFCQVCQKSISISERSTAIAYAGEKAGGWFCGWHTQEEIDKALDGLVGKAADRNGKLHTVEVSNRNLNIVSGAPL